MRAWTAFVLAASGAIALGSTSAGCARQPPETTPTAAPTLVSVPVPPRGTRAYNQKLSERRAAVVVEELTRAGIARTRITLRAFGKDKPVAPNRHPDGSDNPEGRAKNRRVALLIEHPPDAASAPAPGAAAPAKPKP